MMIRCAVAPPVCFAIDAPDKFLQPALHAVERFERYFPQPEAAALWRISGRSLFYKKQLHRRNESTLRRPE
jgi:hypothetical protein